MPIFCLRALALRLPSSLPSPPPFPSSLPTAPALGTFPPCCLTADHDHDGSPYDGPSRSNTPPVGIIGHAAAIAAAVEAADAAAAAGQNTVRFQLPPRPHHSPSTGSLGGTAHPAGGASALHGGSPLGPHAGPQHSSSTGSLGQAAGAHSGAPSHHSSSGSLHSSGSGGHHASHHLRQLHHEQRRHERDEQQQQKEEEEAAAAAALAEEQAAAMDDLAARLAVLQSR